MRLNYLHAGLIIGEVFKMAYCEYVLRNKTKLFYHDSLRFICLIHVSIDVIVEREFDFAL